MQNKKIQLMLQQIVGKQVAKVSDVSYVYICMQSSCSNLLMFQRNEFCDRLTGRFPVRGVGSTYRYAEERLPVTTGG